VTLENSTPAEENLNADGAMASEENLHVDGAMAAENPDTNDLEIRLEVCRDGSHTVFSPNFGQFYHNPNGAVAESLHVFFEVSGLISMLSRHEPVRILEVGFGTGLNAMLLADLIVSLNSSSQVHFQSLEAWPISPEMARELNYRNFLSTPALAEPIIRLFEDLQLGSASAQVLPNLRVEVHRGTFETLQIPVGQINRIFHDPFSPEVNGELWTSAVFSRLAEWSSEDAVLTTYCAATRARAAMAIGGWFVARAPGALGKREMTIASRAEKQLEGYVRLNESRLRDRFATEL